MQTKGRMREWGDLLSNFTQALGEVVEYLQTEIKSQKSGLGVDKEMIDFAKKSTPMMLQMVESIKDIKKDTVEIKNKQDEILRTLHDIKTEKRNSIFDKIERGTIAHKSIVEGMKTVMLVATGVLAMGVAFKLIKGVDFVSVIAMSIAIPLMAEAFAKIAQIPDLSGGKILKATVAVVAMAAAITLSSLIFRLVAPISIAQTLTILGVTAAMTIAAFGVVRFLKAIEGAKPKDIFLLPLIVPAMAAGIVGAAWVFQAMPEKDLPIIPLLKATVAVAAMGVLMSIPLAAFRLFKITPETAIEGSLSIVAIAGGMVLSSLLLSEGNYTNFPSLSWGVNVMVAMLLSLPVVVAMGLLGIQTALMGTASMVIIAAGITAVSYIFKAGDFSGGPSLEWAKTFGLIMLAMVPSAIVLGIPGMILIATMGVATMLVLAAGLTAIADVVRGGNYTGGPTKEWSEGVGLALVLFGNALANISPGFFARWLSGETTTSRVKNLIDLASGLKDISDAVRSGVYDNAPSREWSEGVGLALVYFASALDSVSPGLIDRIFGENTEKRIGYLVSLAGSISEISKKLGKTDYSHYPTAEWLNSVSMMGDTFKDLSQNNADIQKGLDVFNDMVKASEGVDTLADSYDNLSKSIKKVIDVIKNIGTANMENVNDLAAAFIAISVVDRSKVLTSVNDFFDVVEDRIGNRAVTNKPDNLFEDIKTRISRLTGLDFGGRASAPTVTTANTIQQQGEDLADVIKSSIKELKEVLEKIEKHTGELAGDTSGDLGLLGSQMPISHK